MSNQVDYHLARARAAASSSDGAAPCAVGLCAEGLVRALSKIHAGRELRISTQIAPDVHARVRREDLEEILGNLLDNACKWARSMVVLEASQAGGGIVITVDDDGPGLPESQRSLVLQRGVRLDEKGDGAGLGLAIVRDLSELYGGSVSLHGSALGGLQARVLLPRGSA